MRLELHGVRHGRFGAARRCRRSGAARGRRTAADLHANRSHDCLHSSIERAREHRARPRGRSIRRSDRLQRGLRPVVAPRVTKPGVRRRRAAHQRSPAFEQSEEASRRLRTSRATTRCASSRHSSAARSAGCSSRSAAATRSGSLPLYAAHGERWRSVMTVCKSLPLGWTYPHWWYGAAKALARACLGARIAARTLWHRGALALTDNASRRACAPARAAAAPGMKRTICAGRPCGAVARSAPGERSRAILAP